MPCALRLALLSPSPAVSPAYASSPLCSPALPFPLLPPSLPKGSRPAHSGALPCCALKNLIARSGTLNASTLLGPSPPPLPSPPHGHLQPPGALRLSAQWRGEGHCRHVNIWSRRLSRDCDWCKGQAIAGMAEQAAGRTRGAAVPSDFSDLALK